RLGVGLLVAVGPGGARLLGQARRGWPGDPERPRPALVATWRPGRDEERQLAVALGRCYARGLTPDFAAWDRPWPRAKVALPTYPFQRRRYWVEGPRAAAAGGGGWWGPRQELASGEAVHSGQLGCAQQPWLAQHRLFGTMVAPGALYAAMALATRPGPWRLAQGVIARPLSFPGEQADRQVQLVLKPGPKQSAHQLFEIYSKADDTDSPWTLHVTGTITPLSEATAETPGESLARLKERLQVRSVEEHYAAFAQAGITLGPYFQTLRSLWGGKAEALAEVEVPIDTNGSNLPVHPNALDACLQVALAAGETASPEPYVPFEWEEIDLWEPVPDRFYCYARLREERSPETDMFRGDLWLLDEQERLIGRIVGLVNRRATSQHLSGDAGGVDDWLYEVAWREQGSTQPQADFWPDPAQLVRSVENLPAVAPREEEGALPAGLTEALEGLGYEYACRALQELGWRPAPGEAVTEAELFARLGAVETHRKLFTRLLGILADRGLLQRRGNAWQVCRVPEPCDLEKRQQELLQRHPDGRIELGLLARCGARLASVVRGQCDPLGLLFPAEGLGAQELYRDAPRFRLLNRLVQQVVSAGLADLPAMRRVRVLEIGAGTGATAAAVLPALPAEQTDYRYTDISAGFFDRAQRRLTTYNFVRYQVLNIERAPADQGIETGQCDLVIAANVLHATRDLTTTLRHVRQLLVPGGLLVLVEGIQRQGWLDLTFGMLDGWWRFADEWRTDSAFLDTSQWARALAQQGFGLVQAITPGEASGHAVIVARLDSPARDVNVCAGGGWWLVAADRQGVGEKVVERLRRKGKRCVLVTAGDDQSQRLSDERYTCNGQSSADWERLLQARCTPEQTLDGVLHLWSLDTAESSQLTPDTLRSGTQLGCASALALAQALVRRHVVPEAGLWLATSGAQAIAGEGCGSLAQSALWGLGKVIALEHPELGCRLVDLENPMSTAQVDALMAELLGPGAEDQIAWRGGRRFVARLRRLVDAGERLAVPPEGDYSLTRAADGSLERLELISSRLSPPDAGEVQVEARAAGLNFRDVLIALGMYPDRAALLGYEVAGRVIAVGPDVSGFAPGDEVVGLAPGGAFANRMNVPAALLARKPPGLSFVAAATLPVAFATAELAFQRVDLRRGERVLIHAASGGVGLAAIQLARQIGAEVFATASAGKRDYLRSLGVEHVYDSRTTAYGPRILTDTNGCGVHVVLNSLTGEGFIENSLRALGPGGRFVEIAKRDIWTADRVAAIRPDVRYEILALDEEAGRDPEPLGLTLGDLVRRVEQGELRPLPHSVYDFADARLAFRQMQQARHIGKIVLETSSLAAGRLSPDGEYLITGGLGGLGLEVARWLVQRGARSVVLNGRRPPAPHVQSAIDELRQLGSRVDVVLADVAQETEVERLLGHISRDGRRLEGVFHLVGALHDGALLNQTWRSFEEVLWPKVLGAWHLHRMTVERAPGLFVLFSSVASLLGSRGQANHAAANMFLDMLAHHRRAMGLPAMSINWGPWAGVGAAAERQSKLQSYYAHAGLNWLSPEGGVQALERILLAGRRSQAGVVSVNWALFQQGGFKPFLAEIVAPGRSRETRPANERTSSAFHRRLESLPAEQRPEFLVNYVQQELMRVLQLEAPPTTGIGFRDLGMDSLMAVEFRNRLNTELRLEPALTATALFDFPNVGALVSHLVKHLAAGGAEPAAAGTITVTDRTPAPNEPVAVVGLSCRLPGAPNAEAFWDLLASGRDAITEVPRDRWDVDAYYDPDPEAPGKIYTRNGGFLEQVDQFDAGFFQISPREAVSLDPQHRLLLELSWEALESGATDPDKLQGSRSGVYVGLCSSDYAELLELTGPQSVDAYWATGTAHSTAAGRISYLLGLQGPSVAIDTACSSSLVAVHQACQDLLLGRCDLALAGGVNMILRPEVLIQYCKARMLSVDGRCKAFDAAADGFGRAEGGGVVVLKRLADARRDGDPIRALIRGSAVNQDGASAGLTAPNGPAQERVIAAALRQAGVAPAEVAYLEAHGTGTRLGDPIELQAAAAALGPG
ncbi:MAG: SDR family NAD(P)-dependent oxidoreductase, partial [Verrucomicrobia bacterium]|nr:SDR family NAD(P)-dependent oxidoreductase [Verrucomicrobiota bacterium]